MPSRCSRSIAHRVGLRLSERRTPIKMPLEKLADSLGVSTIQLGEYEFGLRMLEAHRLAQAAEFLGVPIRYFFETSSNLYPVEGEQAIADTAMTGGKGPDVASEVISDDFEFYQLLGAFYGITDPGIRTRVIRLMSSLRREKIQEVPDSKVINLNLWRDEKTLDNKTKRI